MRAAKYTSYLSDPKLILNGFKFGLVMFENVGYLSENLTVKPESILQRHVMMPS